MKKYMEKNVLIVSNNIECERHVQFFSQIEKYFEANGWSLIDNLESSKRAQMIVICACGYHKMMYDRVADVLKVFREKGYSDQEIIISGCLPKTFEDDLKGIFSGHLVEFRKPEKFDTIIESQIGFKDISLDNVFNIWGEKQDSRNKMFYIKIADGCLGHCTYCVIKRSKGSITSISKEEILKQYLKAINSGHKKIFLMGDDTFAYGADIGTNIIELLNYLFSQNDTAELYFGSLDIRWFRKYYDDIFKFCKEGKIKKLDFGIQHVDKNVLTLMCRDKEFDEAYDKLCKLKESCPEIFLSCDIMVGFPGETQESFDKLVDFFKKDKCFSTVKHYGFSELEGTPAAKLDSKMKVHPLQIAHRWQILKNVLGNRSMYNSVTDPDSQGEAFQRTFDESIFLCNNSYIEV